MNLERLVRAASIANAVNQIVVLPVALSDSWVVVRAPKQVSVARVPVAITLSLRNVGTDDCRIEAVRPHHGAALVRGQPERLILRAHAPEAEATRVDLELRPFLMTEPRVMLRVEVETRGALNGSRQGVFCEIECYREAADGPFMLVEPAEVRFDPVPVRGLHLFELMAPGAKKVELDVVDPPGPYRNKDMIRRPDGRFQLAVPLEEGVRYAYRFNIDGVVRRDLTVPVVEDVPGFGECSPLDVPLYSESRVRLRNVGTRELTIEAKPERAWLSVAGPKRLRRDHEAELKIRVDPRGLASGTHEASLVLETNDAAMHSHQIPVQLPLDGPGPVIHPLPSPLDLGVVYVGVRAEKFLDLLNVGTAPLIGRLTSDDAAIKPAEFAIEPSSAPFRVPLVILREATIAGPRERQLGRLVIDSNTLVVGESRLEIPIKYEVVLTPLKFVPAEVVFEELTIGKRKTVRVRVSHDNGDRVDAEIHAISLPPWLELSMTEPGTIKVDIRGDLWHGTRDEPVKLALRLRDRKTGCSGVVTVKGTLVVPKLERPPKRLHFGALTPKSVRTLQLALKNSGRGDLEVRKVVLDQKWLAVASDPTKASDSEATLNVTVNAADLAAGRHYAQIDLLTNDPANSSVSVEVQVLIRA